MNKIMKNIYYVTLISMLSTLAVADQKVRLVVTKNIMESMSTMSYGISSVNVQEPFEVIEVEGVNVQSEIARLKMDRNIKNVEISYPTSIPTPFSQEPAYLPNMASGNSLNTPDDERYNEQYSWKDYTSIYKGQSNIEKAHLKSHVNKKVNVAVLDSGFRNTLDLTWSGGYNFSTVDLPVGKRYYLDYDVNSCTTGHGQAVGEIIGAKTNNAYGMAGIVNAGMYAVRVLGCDNVGYLDEAAKGIRWAAGDPSVSASNRIGVDIKVINMSLGAEVDYCPTYMQSAIDYAIGKGISIVVSAGNDSIDASNFTPANCNGVITVGSVNRSGEQSYFSNYGANVDVSALGELVLSAGTTGQSDYSYWSGTSFSAPIQTGIIAMGLSFNPSLSPDVVKGLVKQHTNPFALTVKPMGTGVSDAFSFYNKIESDVSSKVVSLNSIMKTGERCTTSLYEENQYINACEIFEVTVVDFRKDENKYYVVFELEEGEAMFSENGTAIKASKESVFLVNGINPNSSNYGVQVCADKSGNYCESNLLIDLKDDEITLPVSCNI